MTFEIGSLKDLREQDESTHFSFNLGICEGEREAMELLYVLAGMRVVNNKIYAPARKVKGKYFTIAYLSREWAKEVYDSLQKNLPAGYELLPFEDATKALIANDKTLKMFLPELY